MRLFQPSVTSLVTIFVVALSGAPPLDGADPVPTELLRSARSASGVDVQDWDQVWKSWGLKSRPEDFRAERRERYGIHAPPYDNGDLAMGLVKVDTPFGVRIATDCLLCHASNLNGNPVIGLGNASLDFQTLTEDVLTPNRLLAAGLFMPTVARVRGTIEASARRSVYDTRRPGQSNSGHTFGDELSDKDRWDVIEYLKTL